MIPGRRLLAPSRSCWRAEGCPEPRAVGGLRVCGSWTWKPGCVEETGRAWCGRGPLCMERRPREVEGGNTTQALTQWLPVASSATMARGPGFLGLASLILSPGRQTLKIHRGPTSLQWRLSPSIDVSSSPYLIGPSLGLKFHHRSLEVRLREAAEASFTWKSLLRLLYSHAHPYPGGIGHILLAGPWPCLLGPAQHL